jgi:hypothetical protein
MQSVKKYLINFAGCTWLGLVYLTLAFQFWFGIGVYLFLFSTVRCRWLLA